jgi:hypothetical protein
VSLSILVYMFVCKTSINEESVTVCNYKNDPRAAPSLRLFMITDELAFDTRNIMVMCNWNGGESVCEGE